MIYFYRAKVKKNTLPEAIAAVDSLQFSGDLVAIQGGPVLTE